jgi:hypothetical protein
MALITTRPILSSARNPVVLALSVLAVACGSSSGASPTATAQSAATGTTGTAVRPSAQAVSLTLKDLPAGYQQTQGRAFSYPQSHYTSYAVTFGKSTSTAVPIVVKSNVARYINRKASISTYPSLVSHQASIKGYTKTGSVPKLGDESTTGTTKTEANGVPLTGYAVVFRRDVYIASVSVTGPKGTVSQKQANQLAFTIDHRITSGR